MNETAFSTLDLKSALLGNLESLGYVTMTPIQAHSLPHILAGKDVIGQGKTGSGKTAAFGLGILQTLDVTQFRVQALVLCPTRELADQVARDLRDLARGMPNIKVLSVCGGTPLGPQAASLQHGAHIVVGTPGRIEDHLNKGSLQLAAVHALVLDEADRMLDMGFHDAIAAIAERLPRRRQTLLFSATFAAEVKAIAHRFLHDPVMVKVESVHDHASIHQHFYRVSDHKHRLIALRLLLMQYQPRSALVFCNTKKAAADVAAALRDYGFSALALHGDLEQKDRDQTLVRFANNSISILVATDVAARGLDIDALDAVINYEIAQDAEGHLHRIGRTGRAGNKGVAYSLFSDKESHKVARFDSAVDPITDSEALPPLVLLDMPVQKPLHATLQIGGGKKQKLRPGDVLGALTGANGIAAHDVGKIQIADNWTYVAVNRAAVRRALKKLGDDKLKGRSFRVTLIGD